MLLATTKTQNHCIGISYTSQLNIGREANRNAAAISFNGVI